MKYARFVDSKGLPQLVPLKPETLAYLAGYFDGEGTVTTNVLKGVVALRIAICSGDRTILSRFVEELGGRLYSVRRVLNTRRQLYIWTFGGNKARAVLLQLLPYLIAKKEVAEMAIAFEFSLGRRGQHLSPEETEKRRLLRAAISAINQRVTYAT